MDLKLTNEEASLVLNALWGHADTLSASLSTRDRATSYLALEDLVRIHKVLQNFETSKVVKS